MPRPSAAASPWWTHPAFRSPSRTSPSPGSPPRSSCSPVAGRTSSRRTEIVPRDRTRYLAEIAESVRGYHRATQDQAEVARRLQHLEVPALHQAKQIVETFLSERATAAGFQLQGRPDGALRIVLHHSSLPYSG